jgi:hypothetical protein
MLLDLLRKSERVNVDAKDVNSDGRDRSPKLIYKWILNINDVVSLSLGSFIESSQDA